MSHLRRAEIPVRNATAGSTAVTKVLIEKHLYVFNNAF